MNRNLRRAANVSEECMERVYVILREMDIDHLQRMWIKANRRNPQDLLLRHQIAFTIERKLSGRW